MRRAAVRLYSSLSLSHRTAVVPSPTRRVLALQRFTRLMSTKSEDDKNNEDDATVDLQSTRDYCVDLVFKHDYQSYLAGLLFPATHRNAYFAIKAYNVEIATVKDQVPKTAMQSARLRFNFWRDVLRQISENKALPKHVNQPVALELLQYVHQYNLDVRLLERNLEARLSDVTQNGAFETMDDLENYAEFAHSSINYLLLQVLGIDNEELQFAASHLGVAAGIVSLLRGYAHHAQQGCCYIPKEVRINHALPDNVAISGPKNEREKQKLQEATHDVASQAHAHLDAARKLFNKHPLHDKAFFAMMSAIPTSMYLELLLRNDSDPFLACVAASQQTPLKIQWNTLKAVVSKQI